MNRRVKAKLWPVAVALGGAFLLAAQAGTPAALAEEGGGLDGKEVFLAQKCNMCHGVPSAEIAAKTKSAAMKGPDLPTASDRDAEWIMKYVRKEVQLHEKNHKKQAKASDEELAALIAWLEKQPAVPVE